MFIILLFLYTNFPHSAFILILGWKYHEKINDNITYIHFVWLLTKIKKADYIDDVTDIMITIDNLTNTSASLYLYIEEGYPIDHGISEWFRIDVLKMMDGMN